MLPCQNGSAWHQSITSLISCSSRRKSFDLTQEQLSDRTGLSRGQIKNWETDRHEPNLEILKVLVVF